VLSAVAVAEIKATVQSTIVQTISRHRHFVAARTRTPSTMNVFYDNHGDVTVNDLGAPVDASQGLRVNIPKDREPEMPHITTIDTHTTDASTPASITISTVASATGQAAAAAFRR
jgi:hypothetical protein